MRKIKRTLFLSAAGLLLFSFPLLAKATLPEPGCNSLDSWVSSKEKNEQFEVQPGVKLYALFKDQKLLPLFDKSITKWEKKDYQSLGTQLSKCRKEAKTNKNTVVQKNYTWAMRMVRSYSRDRVIAQIQKGKPAATSTSANPGQPSARGTTAARPETTIDQPFDLAPFLSNLLTGDEVEDLTLQGLQPGMKTKNVLEKLKSNWGYVADSRSMEANTYTVPRKQRSQYKAERRSGGQIKLFSLDNGKVGQIRFEEHFLGLSLPAQAQKILTQQLGKPEKVQPGGGGIFMTWKDDDYRLQVLVANQVDVFWKGAGYKSRLLLSMWNEDFEEHLQEINERCNEIKSKSRRDRSMKESTFMMAECNLGSQGRKPGL